jgi:hypothetical protein
VFNMLAHQDPAWAVVGMVIGIGVGLAIVIRLGSARIRK